MLTVVQRNELGRALDGRLEHAVQQAACEALGLLEWADWRDEPPAAKAALLLLALWERVARLEGR